MDHRLNVDEPARMPGMDKVTSPLNADVRKLDHRLRVDRRRKLSVAVAVPSDSSNQRHKANV